MSWDYNIISSNEAENFKTTGQSRTFAIPKLWFRRHHRIGGQVAVVFPCRRCYFTPRIMISHWHYWEHYCFSFWDGIVRRRHSAGMLVILFVGITVIAITATITATPTATMIDLSSGQYYW